MRRRRLIKAFFADQVDTLRAGIDRNMAEPGPFGAENAKTVEGGRFFDDCCNWTRIAEFEDAIGTSPAAEIAADLMSSKRVQLFHEQVLVKEPGPTSPPFPDHNMQPGQRPGEDWFPTLFQR